MGSNWNNLLSSYRNNGLYFLKNPEGTKNEFEKVAQQHGLKPFVINMQNVTRKQTFLRKMAAALNFPDCFGNNWDALFDSLTDLSWLEADEYLILINNLHMLATRSPENFKFITQVFKAAADYWRSRKTPFYIVISEKHPVSGSLSHEGSPL